MLTRRHLLGGIPILGATTLMPATAWAQGPRPTRPRRSRPPGPNSPLTNLSHLRQLLEPVTLTETPTHTTYDIDRHSQAMALWTYADRQEDGSYHPVGGGRRDPATGWWTQGAFNADDLSRAAVVFIRSFATFGHRQDRETAAQLLRTLTYLQVSKGPDRGNVVLWMQEDGTLNRSAEPVELPDPSDSDESFWLARTVWALGEAISVLGRRRTGFVRFLERRMDLALTALERVSLSRYGRWDRADGVPVPRWLIAGGADATGEALLGLAAFVTARPQHRRARRALSRYAEAVTAMGSGSPGVWPYGAILPSVESQSLWHAWGGLAPAGLAAASRLVSGRRSRTAAQADVGVFTPQLLTSGGPYNSWSPWPGESQIAYGVHSRVESLLTVSSMTGGAGLEDLAGICAGWFFGANPAGESVFDPSTGATVDGIEPDGTINRNSGAESSIHAALTMIELDRHPRAARLARSLTATSETEGPVLLEAEDAEMAGGARVITPEEAWTGESNWQGSFVRTPSGASVRFDLSNLPEYSAATWEGAEIHALLHRHDQNAGTSRWFAIGRDEDRTELGRLDLGGVGAPGSTPWKGILKPFALRRSLPRGTCAVEVVSAGLLDLDGVIVMPGVTAAVYRRDGSELVLRAATTRDGARCSIAREEHGSAWSPAGLRRHALNRGQHRLRGGEFALTHR